MKQIVSETVNCPRNSSDYFLGGNVFLEMLRGEVLTGAHLLRMFDCDCLMH